MRQEESHLLRQTNNKEIYQFECNKNKFAQQMQSLLPEFLLLQCHSKELQIWGG